jgi:hypothetical protein
MPSPFESEVRPIVAERSSRISFLGILGFLGASAMGLSAGASARVFFAPADA